MISENLKVVVRCRKSRNDKSILNDPSKERLEVRDEGEKKNYLKYFMFELCEKQ